MCSCLFCFYLFNFKLLIWLLLLFYLCVVNSFETSDKNVVYMWLKVEYAFIFWKGIWDFWADKDSRPCLQKCRLMPNMLASDSPCLPVQLSKYIHFPVTFCLLFYISVHFDAHTQIGGISVLAVIILPWSSRRNVNLENELSDSQLSPIQLSQETFEWRGKDGTACHYTLLPTTTNHSKNEQLASHSGTSEPILYFYQQRIHHDLTWTAIP